MTSSRNNIYFLRACILFTNKNGVLPEKFVYSRFWEEEEEEEERRKPL